MADEEDFETSPEKFDYNVSPSPEQTSVVDFSLAKKKSAPPNKKKMMKKPSNTSLSHILVIANLKITLVTRKRNFTMYS